MLHKESYILKNELDLLIFKHSPTDNLGIPIEESKISRNEALGILVTEFHKMRGALEFGKPLMQEAQEHADFLDMRAKECGIHPDYQDNEPE